MTPRWLLVCGILLASVALPARAVEQEKVNAAVARGGEYLRKTLANPQGGGQNHGIGGMALAGLAMLEAGVRADDPAVQNVTRLVRERALGETQTYHVSLSILYLDRLGDPADVPLIQLLGVRLYAGMDATGGWTYNCGGDLNPNEVARLQAALQQNTLTARPGGPAPQPEAPAKPNPAPGFPQPKPKGTGEPTAAEPAIGKLHPEVARYYLAVRQGVRGRGMLGGDNSNTQFGLIGLWVAARHGVPADDAFLLIANGFLALQNRADFGWGYSRSGTDTSTTSMTCAGLLGLAVGQARANRPAPPTGPMPPAGNPNDPFDNPRKAGAKEPEAPAPRRREIDNALRAIGQVIQITAANPAAPQPQPGLPPGGVPGLPPGGAPGGNMLRNFVGLGNEYYMLWSIERVAMTYGLKTIGNADWFAWGCNFLLPAQQPDGSWQGGYGGEVDTAFAILFLTRSNFVRDLTRRLGGQVQDPGNTELRSDRNKPALFAPKTQEGGSRPSGQMPPATPPSTPPEPTPTLPPVTAPADPVADALVAATGADWDARLRAARDSKGAEHTAGLVRAIPRLDEARRKQAREALAERLTRMTAATLRGMLKDENPELRRAASLACAMKEDRSHIPDLIERITDSSDLVVRAARAGLRSLTDQDFGPPAGADEATRVRARADWQRWYDSQRR